MNLISEQEFTRLQGGSTSFALILIGAIIFAVFYNTLVWGRNKEAAFYLHLLMLLTILATLVNEYFFVIEELLPAYHTRVYAIRLLLVTLQNIWAVLFFCSFLQTKTYSPRLHRAFLYSYLIPACSVNIVLYCSGNDEVICVWIPPFFVWGLVLAITMMTQSWKRRSNISRAFMACFLFNSVVLVALNFLRSHFNATFDYVNIFFNLNSFGGPYLIAINIILFSFVLAYRVIELRSRYALEQQQRIHVEKERHLIQEQNIELHTMNLEMQRQQAIVTEQATELELKNTELQENLETLRRTQAQLAQAEKMASLGTLVAGVAHELNTPIGVAVTAASTLHARTLDFAKHYSEGALKKSELEAYVQTATTGADLTLRNLERAANLIQSFKQVSVDQTYDNIRRFGVKQYLHEIITSLQPKWKTTGHRVEIECDEALEMETYAGAIAQIITNFVTNSLLHGFEDYTEEGVMKIEAMQEGSNVVIKYSDNGRGIPPEILPRIFDPFFTTKQANGGTGLGMHIVYNLATQKLQGTVQVKSTLELGVECTLTVPIVVR